MSAGTKLKTTDLGYVNRNRQVVVQQTSLPGTDHLQKIYVLRCLNPECRHEYGANGSDVFQRKCPSCQGGRPGFPVKQSKTPEEVLAGIDALDDEGPGTGFPDDDHDRILYGSPDPAHSHKG